MHSNGGIGKSSATLSSQSAHSLSHRNSSLRQAAFIAINDLLGVGVSVCFAIKSMGSRDVHASLFFALVHPSRYDGTFLMVNWWDLIGSNNQIIYMIYYKVCTCFALMFAQSVVGTNLAIVIKEEIEATNTYINHLETKARRLQQIIEYFHHNDSVTWSLARSSQLQKKRGKVGGQRKKKSTPMYFDDWFSRHSQVYSDVTHIELISFHSHDNRKSNRRSNNHMTMLTLQFLMYLDKEKGILDFYHPVSKELLWHQYLPIRSQITKIIFDSKRTTNLLILTKCGSMLMYNVRLYHGRRMVSGAYRRPTANDKAQCHAWISPPSTMSWIEYPFIIESNQDIPTMPPSTYHLHMTFEPSFIIKPRVQVDQAIIVTYHNNIYVVTSNTRGVLSFFHGTNGSHIVDLPEQHGRITEMQLLSTGIVGFIVNNQIKFVDALDQHMVPLLCYGSIYNFTSLEKDQWRQNVLYAGTNDGRGLVFRLKHFEHLKRNNGNIEAKTPSCVITAQLQSRHHLSTSPRTLVRTLPGYLVFTTGKTVVLYTTPLTSADLPTYITETELISSNTEHIISIESAKDVDTSPIGLAFVVKNVNGSQHMELFESHLPPPTSSFDLGWIRAPIMLLCALGIMFWHQVRITRHRPNDWSNSKFLTNYNSSP